MAIITKVMVIVIQPFYYHYADQSVLAGTPVKNLRILTEQSFIVPHALACVS